ncbi:MULTISPECIES: hypothetical protein [Eikenella]|uniref:Uncharacterized protein n=1 Tax=Eikenella longinqua TaxID=1795827 RepID=A0A1A9RYF3_9NEIS|nr:MULTISPECIES: hypothetical protein [Eikenella]OAM29191.1 hypothetical protein A7P95_04395 [Eikenella longinqua]
MKRNCQIFYSFYTDDSHVDGNRPITIATDELPAYFHRLQLHPDFLGIIDRHDNTFQIVLEEFSGYYWAEIPDPVKSGYYGRFYTADELLALLERLPDEFVPQNFPGLSFQPWQEYFEDTPYGKEAQRLFESSGDTGEMVRVAEDICESCRLGAWDALCDDGLALLQRELTASPAAFTDINYQRLCRSLDWLEDLVAENASFDEDSMDDLCDMLLERIVDLDNYRQPRH